MRGSNKVGGVLRDKSGGVAVIFALMLPVIVGMLALGVEVGMWYKLQGSMQAVADAAAMAGDRELANGGGLTAVTNAATVAAQLNGCTANANCWINQPAPNTFTSTGSTVLNGVQVTALTKVTPLFAALYFPAAQRNADGTINIKATGKAAYTVQGGGGGYSGTIAGCVLGLDSNAAYTVALSNNAIVGCATNSNSKCQGQNSPTCSFDAATYGSYSCSSSNDPQCGAALKDKTLGSMYLNNNAAINSVAASAGNIYLGQNATVTTKVPNSTQVTDPYAGASYTVPTTTNSLVIKGGNGSTDVTDVSATPAATSAIDISVADGACSTTAVTYTNNKYVHIHPGCYNGWEFQNNATITLYDGYYKIKSKFILQNNAIIKGGSVGTALIFVGSGSSSYAISIGNNAQLKLTAPNWGTMKGIALMSDRSATATIVQEFSNNAVLDIKGAIYFPNQIVLMENNAGNGALTCLQIIGRRVLLSNNATFNLGTNCSSVGGTDITIGQKVSKIIDIVQ